MKIQQRIYLTIGITLAIVILLLLLLILPMVNKIKELSAGFVEKSNLLASYKEKSGDYFAGLKSEYADTESRIAEINKYFVNPEKAIDFIMAVEQIAVKTNNYQEIREINPPASPAGGPEENNALLFQVSLWGSFPNLVKFLAQLENMNYFVDSNSLQVSKIEQRDLTRLKDRGIEVLTGDIGSVINIKAYTR